MFIGCMLGDCCHGNTRSGCVLSGVRDGCGSELEVVSEGSEGEEEEAGSGGDESGEDVREMRRRGDKVGRDTERYE